MIRPLVFALLFLAACAPPQPDAPPTDHQAPETVRDVLYDADALERRLTEDPFSGDHALSNSARRSYVLEQATLADRAARARVGDDDDALIRRLFARRADTRRDSLLACHRQRWSVDPSLPQHPVRRLESILTHDGWSDEQKTDALRQMPQYVRIVTSELRAGLQDDLVASRHAVKRSIAAVDAWLVSKPPASLHGGPDALQMWVFPALRQYRDTLREDIEPVARTTPGLDSLPGGARCYEAELARQLGPSWSADRLRRTAQAAIEDTRRPVGPDSPVTTEANSVFEWATSRWPAAARLVGLQTFEPTTLEVAPQTDATLDTTTWTVSIPQADAGTPLEQPLLAATGFPGSAAMYQSVAAPFHRPWFRTVHSPACDEGWRLYAAHLAAEHDLYSSPDAARGLGQLDRRAAARARADVGLHRDGWSVQQTRAFLVETGGLSETQAEQATDHFVANPGSGAAAFAGFVDLRAAADPQRAGSFRERLLRFGPLPIDLLFF